MAGMRNSKEDMERIENIYKMCQSLMDECKALGYDPDAKGYVIRHELKDLEKSLQKAMSVSETISKLRDEFYDHLKDVDENCYWDCWGVVEFYMDGENYLVLQVNGHTYWRYDFTKTEDGYEFSEPVPVEMAFVTKSTETSEPDETGKKKAN